MRMHRARGVGAAAIVLALVAVACGKSGGGAKKTAANKGSITMAAFNFSESAILAGIYGKALQPKGWTVTFKNNLGSREVVEPALLKGDVDAYATYAATELEVLNKGAGQASPDVDATALKLRDL